MKGKGKSGADRGGTGDGSAEQERITADGLAPQVQPAGGPLPGQEYEASRERDLARPTIPERIATQLVEHVDFAARIYCHLLGQHEREDVAQDALAALLERAHRNRPVREPNAWLVAVVRKLDAVRRRRRHRGRALRLSDSTVQEPASRDDLWAKLEQLLEAVYPPYTEDEKDDLRALAAGRTRHEIARELGQKVRVVEARIKKSLERLKIFLGSGKSTDGETR